MLCLLFPVYLFCHCLSALPVLLLFLSLQSLFPLFLLLPSHFHTSTLCPQCSLELWWFFALYYNVL